MKPERTLPHSQAPAVCPYRFNKLHNHPMYLICPDVLSTVGESS